MQRGEGVAVEVAAGGDAALQRGKPVLPALGGGGVGANVLEQQQLSGGAEHPRDLAGGVGQVADAAQHEGANDGVGAVSGRGSWSAVPGSTSVRARSPGSRLVQLAGEAAAHVGFGLDEHEPLDLLGAVVRQVGAGAGADLDVVHRGEQPAGEPAEPAALLVAAVIATPSSTRWPGCWPGRCGLGAG